MMTGLGSNAYLDDLLAQEEERRRERQRMMLAPANLPQPDFSNDSTVYAGGSPGITRRDLPRGFLMPQTFGGEDLSQAEASRARGAAFAALGTGLLRHAGTGDLAGGLAEGLEGFSAARDRSLAQDRAMKLQNEERERQAAQEADRVRQSDLTYRRGSAEYDAFIDQQERGKRLRAATGKSASDMVAEIERTLGQGSPEAARARALASLGEDADLNKLAGLHEDATTRARRTEDAEFALGVKTKEHEAIANLPSELRQEARADESLAIQRQYAERAAANAEGGKPPTIEQREDNIRTSAEAYVQKMMAAAKAQAEATTQFPVTNPVTGALERKPAFTAQDIDKWRSEGRAIAEREMYGGAGGRQPGQASPRPTIADIEARLGHPLSPADRAEAEAALGYYTIDQILEALRTP